MLCGPSDLVFKKPAILSFQHCAALKQSQWRLSVFYSDSAPEDPPNWQVNSWAMHQMSKAKQKKNLGLMFCFDLF